MTLAYKIGFQLYDSTKHHRHTLPCVHTTQAKSLSVPIHPLPSPPPPAPLLSRCHHSVICVYLLCTYV